MRIASSYAAPSSRPGYAIDPPTKPAAAAMRLLYWKTSPNRLVGCIVPRSFSADTGVAFRYSNSHSMSWRGSPVHAHTRCFTSTCFVVAASPSLNAG